MVILSPELHAYWGLGYFILEPLTAESTTLELKSRFQWIPKHQATDGVTIGTLPSSLEAPPKPSLVINVDTGEFINDGCIVTLRTAYTPEPRPTTSAMPFGLRFSHGWWGDMLETVESDFDVSLVAASEHSEGNIKATSSRTASCAGTIGFCRPQLTVAPYFSTTELSSKASLAGGVPVDGNSSSENPELGNMAVPAAKFIELQTVTNPPSASESSPLEKRHSPQVPAPRRSPFTISLKKRGKSTIRMICATSQNSRKRYLYY